MVAVATSLVMSSQAWAQTIVKVATVVPDGPATEIQGFKIFKEYVEFRSNGEIEVQPFFGQLGGEREMIEQYASARRDGHDRRGAIAISTSGPALLHPHLSRPRRSPDVLRSPVRQAMAEEMRRLTGGARWLSESGFRNITNNPPIRTPADMAGLKMRTMESPVFMELMRSVGAAATPIAFNETILALRQGVVDGQENAAPTVHVFGVWEVQKYMSINEHIYSPRADRTDAFYMSLPEEHKQIFADGARLCRDSGYIAKRAAPEDIEMMQRRAWRSTSTRRRRRRSSRRPAAAGAGLHRRAGRPGQGRRPSRGGRGTAQAALRLSARRRAATDPAGGGARGRPRPPLAR